MLSGKLTYNAVAVKEITVEKKKLDIIIAGNQEESEKITDYLDHPFQGEVVGVGERVVACKPGDIVLFKISRNYSPVPYLLNDNGEIYKIYNDNDIALVRECQS